MSIITQNAPTAISRPAHESWCATKRVKHTSGGECFSNAHETPAGGVWVQASDGDGPVIVADTRATLRLTAPEAFAFIAGMASALADATTPDDDDTSSPLAWDVAEAVSSMSEHAAVQLVAALAARLSAGAR
jgi:hypothetical protein